MHYATITHLLKTIFKIHHLETFSGKKYAVADQASWIYETEN